MEQRDYYEKDEKTSLPNIPAQKLDYVGSSSP